MAVKQSDFAEWLDRTMSKRQLSARQIAAYAGVSNTTVMNWLLGGLPRPESLKKVALALNEDADYLSRLVGYGSAIAEPSTLTGDEQELLRAYRAAGAGIRGVMLASLQAIGAAALREAAQQRSEGQSSQESPTTPAPPT